MMTALVFSGFAIAFVVGLLVGAAIVVAGQKQRDREELARLAETADVVSRLCAAVTQSHHDVRAQLAKSDAIAASYTNILEHHLQVLRQVGAMIELRHGRTVH